MTDAKRHREALIARLVSLNPFAGLDYYKSLTTEQLEETVKRFDRFCKRDGD